MTQFKLCAERVVYCLISIIICSICGVKGSSEAATKIHTPRNPQTTHIPYIIPHTRYQYIIPHTYIPHPLSTSRPHLTPTSHSRIVHPTSYTRILHLTPTSADVTTCPGGGFRCPIDGDCIPKGFVCDKDEDCVGGADELNCHIRSCQPGQEFKCESSDRCIYNSQRCNGQFDCPDQSDELNCNNNTCPPGFFKCTTIYECIDENWTCDGDKDCDDSSDEMDCGPSVTICSPQQFRCNNGKCINRGLMCDGFSNCPDNEDETNCGSFHQQTTQKMDTTITAEKHVKKYDVIVTTDENVDREYKVDSTVVARNENAFSSGDEDDGNWTTYMIIIGLITIVILVAVAVALVLSKMKTREMTLEQVHFPL